MAGNLAPNSSGSRLRWQDIGYSLTRLLDGPSLVRLAHWKMRRRKDILLMEVTDVMIQDRLERVGHVVIPLVVRSDSHQL